jgi:hypothetical protein
MNQIHPLLSKDQMEKVVEKKGYYNRIGILPRV